ncbi:glyoxylase-like metal-dependent hydrolase (beta-lactamase superfamily II) [Marinobacterium halophilum]|uniref:Glyoxylase-like metal-dependent hydrolase (Beta-lactamase superfamily II) n=1 Tax=Marinobacterium halophilum TaxID=267374 RepID=A0A2P8EN24_9GAMM|nr:MBL fold metallo-hydrolase [Marinobacterium halophilum]PSL10852.1 glyoxylase-like metal-dependent hydrolase (beta-lactamase superfamily II) [Marinobacterium halophilum]
MLGNESEDKSKKRRDDERAALEYPFEKPTESCQLVAISAGVFWARIPMPMALDHINVYVLEDSKGWYLIDTGLNTEASKAAWKELADRYFKEKPLVGVICTHFHYDHAGLASWLMKEFSVPLYMTHGEYFTMRALASSGAVIDRQCQREYLYLAGTPDKDIEKIIGIYGNDPFMPDFPNKYIRLREGDNLSIGGRKWRIVIGEGHSPEHACLYCEEDALLISGDQVLPSISSNVLVSDVEPEANPLKHWLDSLERLKALSSDSIVMPAHGFVFKGLHTRLDQLVAHHHRQFKVLTEFAKNHGRFTAWDAMNVLFPRELKPIDMMLAIGETLSHLNYLNAAEVIVRFKSKDIPDSYCIKSDSYI